MAKSILAEAIQYLAATRDDAKIMTEQEFVKKYISQRTMLPLVAPIVHHPGFKLYRLRSIEKKANEDLSLLSAFSYPKESKTKKTPKLQRANFSGESMFYGSLSHETIFKETNYDENSDEWAYISSWKTVAPLGLFPPASAILKQIEKGNCPNEVPTELQIKYLSLINDIMQEGGDDKATYLPSANFCKHIIDADFSSIEDTRLLHQKFYDGILYNSVRDIPNGYNFAIKKESADQKLQLNFVIRANKMKDKSLNFDQIGFFENGKVKWYEFFVKRESIHVNNYFFETQGKAIDTTHGCIFDSEGKIVKNPMSIFNADSEDWMTRFFSSVTSTFDISEISDKQSLEKTYEYCLRRDFDGWTYKNEETVTYIDSIIFDFSFSVSLHELPGNISHCL